MREALAMIRWRIPELLEERGWTPYRLAQQSGLTVPAAYRLAKGKAVQRIDAATLETLCKLFNAKPGDLLELVDKPPRRKGTA
jgi:DNA-binding Xre family transcriptional regulator